MTTLFKKSLVFAVIVFFIGAGFVPSISSDDPVSKGTIYVDDDADPGWYDATHVKTIQEGIDNATVGDTVFVYNGTYYGIIMVNKPLSLLGEDKNNTVIDAAENNFNVIVSADSVNISKFTITNTSESSTFSVGLFIQHSNHSTISDNIIISNWGRGIRIDDSDNIVVKNNTFIDNGEGLAVQICSNTTIIDNNFFNDGLEIFLCEYSIVINNTVNGKHIVYYENVSDKIIDVNAGQVILYRCENITVQNQELTKTTTGILLFESNNCSLLDNNISSNKNKGLAMIYSDYNTISNNFIEGNMWGICLELCDNNTISKNTVINTRRGIEIGYSNYNLIDGNNISKNIHFGLQLYSTEGVARYNVIHGNNFYDNSHGIIMWFRDNLIYHNNFIKNTNNQDYGGSYWDNGYPSGGNYWDDYTGVDNYHGVNQDIPGNDNIGDTPYDIPGSSDQDHYPLMHPFGTGIVASWHFDEGSGSAAYDSSGNGNDGAIYGASWVTGVSGTGLNYDRVDDYVEVSDSPSLNFGTNDFSVSAWIKTDFSENDKIQIMEKMDRGGTIPHPGFYLRVTDDSGHVHTFEAYLSDGLTDVESYSVTLVNDDKWHLVVATYNRTNNLCIYVDGELEYSEDISGIGDISTTHPLYIGQQDNNDDRFDGLIDEICIYNHVLNPIEIQNLYLQYAPTTPTTPSTPSGPTTGKPGINYEYSTTSIDVDGDNIYYLWDWDDGSEFVWFGPYSSGEICTRPHMWAVEGTYNVKVKAKDQLGLESEWSNPLTVSIIMKPPIADANGPYYGTTDDSIHFDGSGSYDLDGIIANYEWDFGDGHTDTGVNPTHKYSSSGTYNITLTVTDDDGLTDTNDTTAVIGHGNPPTIQLIYPTGGEILNDAVTIRWYAYDSEDDSNLPIYLYYFDEDDNWYQINDVLENTGESDWDTTKLPDGTYELLIQAVDNDGNIGHDSSEPFEIDNHYEPENEPPEKPSKPSGPTSGKAGTSYSYSSSTTDPDGDQVWYKWDWGNETSGWNGPYDSGDTVTASHIWEEKGDYNIKVKAKDVHGEESPWSDPLPITMPKTKAINPFLLFLERLMERYPILEQILLSFYYKLT